MNQTTERIALVTGVSHEKGIGRAISKKLAEEKYDVFFTYWQSKSDWPDQFIQEIRDSGVRCAGMEIDLAQEDAPYQLLDEVERTVGLPNVIVNNAAYSLNDGYKNLDVKLLDDHYAVNMRTPILLSTEFAKRFQQNNKTYGRIINITSGQALGPMTGELAYVATKGAISAFTLSLSAELAPLGITVNAVNPGPTDTGWMTEQLKQELLPKFLMGRIGQPEDAARLVAFLASEEAEWITGQVINSEGGFYRK